jgi:hypothetical protein
MITRTQLSHHWLFKLFVASRLALGGGPTPEAKKGLTVFNYMLC